MAEIVIDSIAKSFGTAVALREVSLTINDGEFVSLLGPSGCGKTTLLRIIAGLETASSGDIRVDGKSILGLPPKDRGLAMVFQNYAIFPHMTVAENIAFGLRMQKADEARVKAQVGKAAELLHISQYLDRYPNKLSGGQRQRVAVARALAVEPSVLLMDEPLSNLDALLRLEMRTELKSVLQEAGTTTVYVTHDQTEAMGLSDRIAIVYQGRIEQVGTPVDVYDNPATRFVGGFIGSPPMNFITIPVADGVAGGQPVPAGVSGEVVMGLRGEAVTRTEDTSGLPLQINVVEPMGATLLVTGTIYGQMVRVSLPPRDTVAAGQTIYLAPDPTRLSWLSPETGIAYQ
ncbi:ABC transporter-like protein [Ketogulonicigenium robustum]|uniref:ABC transporter-like protein n=1 Tax=Ketogulonicigenium robustum TaxID=92947 RepID=A0A1W6NZC8_9RHOB|nr:ABC transporter ATP-binding protein [Ketogulonicigenium robustum]ARO14608.1 ABC transporter-like protein [Ketogulonicigenium robustum]